MFQNCLFIAAALIVAVQGDELNNEPILRNDAEKFLHKLKEKVDHAIAEAHKKLNEAQAKVDHAAQNLQTKAKALMQHAEDGFRKQLDKLKEKAKKSKVNIDECLGKDEEKLVNLPTEGSNNMIQCIQGDINKGFKYAHDALNRIQKAIDHVANLRKEIKKCGHGLKAVKCLAKLAKQIEKDIVTVPAKIKEDAVKTALIITKLKDELEKCANGAVNKVKSEGKAVLERISVCVARKLVHH